MNWTALTRIVAERARNRCEYCGMNQSLQGSTFHVDHILPQSRDGSDELENLCLACPRCNGLKRQLIAANDPSTNTESRLFDPRKDNWAEHFEWKGLRIDGKTPVGRTTVELLEFNSARKLTIRMVEAFFGLLPVKPIEED